jgi:hypothetical protein
MNRAGRNAARQAERCRDGSRILLFNPGRSGGIGRRGGFKSRNRDAGESAQSTQPQADSETAPDSGEASWPPHWPDSLREDAQLCALIERWPTLSRAERRLILTIAKNA